MPDGERPEKLKMVWLFGRKAVLKTRALQTLREYRAFPNRAERLECGAFTAAFGWRETILSPVPQWGIQAQGHSRLTCRARPLIQATPCVPKAVLKTHAVQTLRECHASPNRAERLECGAFTAAFG